MSNRFFKLEEAQACISVLEPLLTDAISSKKKLAEAEGAFHALRARVLMQGGLVVDLEKASGLKALKDDAANELHDLLEEIQATGCVVKDLDIGLIDFPCLVDNREVYLCWKLGEPAIGFWHNTDEGFANRKPIKADFGHPDDNPPPRPN